jgi:hypothetical protein
MPSDVAVVQNTIERIEMLKHKKRSEVLTSPVGPFSPPSFSRRVLPTSQSVVAAEEASCSVARHAQPGDDGAVQHGQAGGSSWLQWLRSPGRAGDAFSRWCLRGVGHLYSFDPSEHGLPSSAALTELASTDAAPVGGEASSYYRTTVQERDCILAHRIRAVASEVSSGDVVAIVGANHLPGILRNWACPCPGDVDCERFLSVPPEGCSAESKGVLWKLRAVEGLATCMEAGVAGAGALAACVSARRLPGLLRFAPLAAIGAGVCVSTAWSADRQRRIAQLVQNLAAHQDVANRVQTDA